MPSGGGMTDVFISYKREEREKVILIADRLRALGLDVWFDARLTTGHHFDREIDDNVRTAKCVLVCWSPAALTSDWVRAEAAIGRERGVIVPLLVEECTPPVPFNTLQTESLIGWSGEGDFGGWARIVARVGELTGRANLPESERARGEREVETRRIQAMLDAQRREEEQAQRRAEAASAERQRLEAELRDRGATAPQSRLAPQQVTTFTQNVTPVLPSIAKKQWRAWFLSTLGAAILIAATYGTYTWGVASGADQQKAATAVSVREAQNQTRSTFSGYWCPYVRYGYGISLEWNGDSQLIGRSGHLLSAQESFGVVGDTSFALRVRAAAREDIDDLYELVDEYTLLLSNDLLVVHADEVALTPEAPVTPADPAGGYFTLDEGRYYRCDEAAAARGNPMPETK